MGRNQVQQMKPSLLKESTSSGRRRARAILLLVGGLACLLALSLFLQRETASTPSAAPKSSLSPVRSAQAQEATQPIPAGDQPIAFSHRIHAGENAIPCQYCHIYAQRSSVAGVPPVALCAGCHQVIATDRPEVQKLMGYWERGEPIPWVRIHDLPDFSRFPHNLHINARNETFPEGVPCQNCHGSVQEMDVVQKAIPKFGLMGWCLECHLSIPGSLARKRALAEAPGSMKLLDWKHPSGEYTRPPLTDCLTCHY